MCESCDRNYLDMSQQLALAVEEYRADLAAGNVPETITQQAQSLATLFYEEMNNTTARVTMAWWLGISFQRAAANT